MKTPNISYGTVIRFLLLAISAVNQVLAIFGFSPIQVPSTDGQSLIAAFFLIVMAVISYWFDNDVTIKARVRKLLGAKALAQDQSTQATQAAPTEQPK